MTNEERFERLTTAIAKAELRYLFHPSDELKDVIDRLAERVSGSDDSSDISEALTSTEQLFYFELGSFICEHEL